MILSVISKFSIDNVQAISKKYKKSFPEKLKNKVETDLQQKFDAEFEKIKVEYNTKLKEQERQQVEAIRKKLRDKLVQLTNRSK